MESFGCAPAIDDDSHPSPGDLPLHISHINPPRAVLNIYKQWLSLRALLEFFVFESSTMKNEASSPF